MRRALWNGLAACVAIVALVASPVALAAKKKTPTPAADASDTKADKKADFGVGGVARLVVLSPQGREVASFGWTTRDEVLLTLRLRSAPPP